ncbi:MAG TPA: chorismate mutase [Planctomycetota bacterium]|nr:chorismate mutase [Planctomycetota bacterium]HRU51870.1 chorismate mutase [Planctomycetota bacterium]
MAVMAVRGATSIEKDNVEHVSERVIELFEKVRNGNHIERMIAVFFSVTPDICSINPASVVRKKFKLLSDVSLMCFQEAMFSDSMPKIIRIVVFFEGNGKNFIYLHKAMELRSDLNLSSLEFDWT